ncbi:MAG TPA: hypothetical protein VD834_04335 [Blastococcus sp.]|nr:hypothetical protein [Blastococcus sp.]
MVVREDGLVVAAGRLRAAGDDWPHDWYGRRGFAPVDTTWSVDRQVRH